MNKTASKNALLLPSGLHDLLPPDAGKEQEAVSRLLGCFGAYGYAQVSPPLLEFETTLLKGRGESLAQQTFRVMDPLSQSMMGLRSDITMQVARIAVTRLSSEPRPLRLCYAGPILQLKAEQLKNERQLTQAGIELIGSAEGSADSEVMILAAEALSALGIKDISIDINLPGLLSELCPEARNDASLQAKVKDAVMRKDAASIAALPVKSSKTLAALIDSTGPLAKGLAALDKLGLPQAEAIKAVSARVKQRCPTLSLTLDPIEYRGFDYHQGIGFSIFAKGLRHELGRGGRYEVDGQSATGFTLYVTHLLNLLPAEKEKRRVLVPQDISADELQKLQTDGWVTVYGLTARAQEEAKQAGIKHVWHKGKVETV